ncbi:hypothetical protein [Sphingomonas sp. RS2018]
MPKIAALIAGALLTGAAPVFAQGPQPKLVVVSADAPFAHTNSKLTLPPTLLDLPRTRVLEIEAPQLDIAAEYMRGDTVLTVYLYRSTAGSVPVWFDRARWAIENRPVYGTPTAAVAPTPIAPPRGNVASGLLASWSLAGSVYRGTALAILPQGEWLVKLRYSSKTDDGAASAEKLRTAIAALGWPDDAPAAPAALPMADCTTRIAFADTTTSLPPDMNAMLLGALGSVAASSSRAKSTDSPAPRWCRDPATVPMGGVYRANESTDSYLLALSDAGRGISVYPSIASQVGAEINKKPRVTTWSVDLATPGRDLIFPLQDKLPSPTRALELLRGQPISSATTWGEKRTVTIPTK